MPLRFEHGIAQQSGHSTQTRVLRPAVDSLHAAQSRRSPLDSPIENQPARPANKQELLVEDPLLAESEQRSYKAIRIENIERGES
jgi:hypothetical protein